MNPHDLRLCYISEGWAYFTTQPIEQQRGDDWDDVPYDANAGDPYVYDPVTNGAQTPWTITKLRFEGPFSEPGEWECPWSVLDINAAMAPWLTPSVTAMDGEHEVVIWAGTTMPRFIELVESVGGTVKQSDDQEGVRA